jgi:hypothetical protein
MKTPEQTAEQLTTAQTAEQLTAAQTAEQLTTAQTAEQITTAQTQRCNYLPAQLQYIIMTVHQTAPHFYDGNYVREMLEMVIFVGQPERHVALQ